MGRLRCLNCGAIYDSPNLPLAEVNALYVCTRCGAQHFAPLAAPPPQVNNVTPVLTASAGAAIGAALGGPPGAIVGGFIGLLIGSKAQ